MTEQQLPQLPEPNSEGPWKSAVLDQLAIACMDAPLDESPASILKRVIDWNVEVALDPRVSERAEAIAIAAVAAERERCAQIAEAMRPNGGLGWSTKQLTCFETLSACADNIRAVLTIKEPPNE